MNKLKVVELFAGIGAWSKALENLNVQHEVVLAVENDKYPMTAYNAIHNTNFKITDITQLNEKDVPDCDIICYSPPCQPFSRQGKELGFQDQRGILFFDALRIIKEKQPKYAIMENVKGLTQKKFKNEFKAILDELEKAGYKNYWKVLNALDYGFPQNRERVFIVSIRKDIDHDFSFPEQNENLNNLMDYLEEDAVLPILHNIYGGFKEKEPRIFYQYSPTIRTAAGGGHIPSVCTKDDSRVEKEIFGYKIRTLTPKECFLLMGFTEDDYNKAKEAINHTYFKGKDKSRTRLYKLAGNSIVVKVCEEIFKKLLYIHI
jgi:site-specific DNA-cytosine methylase